MSANPAMASSISGHNPRSSPTENRQQVRTVRTLDSNWLVRSTKTSRRAEETRNRNSLW